MPVKLCTYVVEMKTGPRFQSVPAGVWVWRDGSYSTAFLPGNEERAKEAANQAAKVTAEPSDFFEYLREQANPHIHSFSFPVMTLLYASAEDCQKAILDQLKGDQ
jgi:hypothetical protein